MGKKAGADGTAKTHNNKTNSGRTMIEIDPDIIYFTHSRIRPQFTGCNKRIQDTIDEIKNGITKVTDIPFITIIENFEPVYVQEPNKGGKGGGGSSKGKNKRNNRTNGPSDDDDGDDDDDNNENMFRDNVKGKKSPTTMQSFYFSLNNRRLFLFKTLKSMGLVDKIQVYVKPALEREKTRYTRQRCAIMAKIMTSKELEEVGEEKDVDEGHDNNNNDGDDETKQGAETNKNDVLGAQNESLSNNNSDDKKTQDKKQRVVKKAQKKKQIEEDEIKF